MGNDADLPCELLFVYGTLMSRFHNVNAIALRQAATLVGPATYRGKMFRVSGPRGVLVYPVVIASDDRTEVVRGELYRLIDRRVLVARAAIGLLDRPHGRGDPAPAGRGVVA